MLMVILVQIFAVKIFVLGAESVCVCITLAKIFVDFKIAHKTLKLPVANWLQKLPVKIKISRGNLGKKSP